MLALILGLCCWGGGALADSGMAAGQRDKALVVFDGDELYFVAGATGFPAVDRANLVVGRIEQLARSGITDLAIDLREEELGAAIFIADTRVDIVTAFDADLEGVEDLHALALLRAKLIVRAIEFYRERRTDQAIKHSIVITAAWTAGFAVLCLLLWFSTRQVTAALGRRVKAWADSMEEKIGGIAETETITSVVRLTLLLVVFVILAVALYFYASQVLYSFPGTRSFAVFLISNITAPLVSLAASASDELPSLIALAVIFFLTRYALKLVRLVFMNIHIGTIRVQGFERSWTWPTFRIVKGIVVIFALVMAYPYVPGSDTAAFKGISIFLGVILSLGSSSVVANLLAGLFVIYRRGVNEGDLISVDGVVGTVESMMVLETVLRSPKNEMISIPNSQIMASKVINYSRKGNTSGYLVHAKVGIGYEEPQTRIEAMLLRAAGRTDGLRTQPAPFVLRTELADFAVVYEINAVAVSTVGLVHLRSRLNANILDVFHEERVQIMTPAYEGDPAEPKIPPLVEAVPERGAAVPSPQGQGR